MSSRVRLVNILPEGLAPVGPGETTPDQHRSTLRNVFNFIRWKDQGTEPGITERQAARCRELIAKGVKVSLNGAVSVFLEHKGWFSNPITRALFDDYVRAGYIELNTKGRLVAMPLEAAIVNENLDVLLAALASGADERLVPSESMRSRPESPEDSDRYDEDAPRYDIFNIFDLIDHEVLDPALRAQMTAAINQAAMERRIRELSATPEQQVNASSATGRRRRLDV